MRISRVFRATTLLLLTTAWAAFGQTTTGDILGTVHDASGAVVPGAKITVRNLETNQNKETVSSDDGAFRVPLLATGSYELLVEKAGFARYRQSPITLSINEKADINVPLTVASSSE